MRLPLRLELSLPRIQIIDLLPQPRQVLLDVLVLVFLLLKVHLGLVPAALVPQLPQHLLQLRVGVALRHVVLPEQLPLLVVHGRLRLEVGLLEAQRVGAVLDLGYHVPGLGYLLLLLLDLVVALLDLVLQPRDLILAILQLLAKSRGGVLVAADCGKKDVAR